MHTSSHAHTHTITDLSSQESAFWTQYTLSTQSSQEECPETFVSHDWSRDHSLLLELATVVHQREPKQYRSVEGREEEEEEEEEKEEEAMDTGDSSSLVPLGRGGTGSRGRVSLGRRLPEWVESAELVETDIAGHSHAIEEFSLPRVIVRNLQRSGVTRLFPVQVCERVCSSVFLSVLIF